MSMDPRREAALQATAELIAGSPPQQPLSDVAGTANYPIGIDSSSMRLMSTDTEGENAPNTTAHASSAMDI